MRKYDRIYLDTNVFIALKETGGELDLKLVDLLAEAPTGTKPFLATSELTLAELLTKPYSENRDDLVNQYDNWILPSPWLDVGPVQRDTLWFAAILRSNYRSIKLPDAIHLSTAFGFKCSHFLTNDKGIKDAYQIVHKKFGLSAASGKLAVIRPTIEVIDDILSDIRVNQ